MPEAPDSDAALTTYSSGSAPAAALSPIVIRATAGAA